MPRPSALCPPARVRRRRTRQERDSAKFGRARPPPPPGRAPATAAARPVVITQHRLTQHAGLFNHEVKSADIARLLQPSPVPMGPGPGATSGKENVPPVPGSVGEAVRELAHQLQPLLDIETAFPGRSLVRERRQAVLGALLQRHHGLPDLTALLRHRGPASTPESSPAGGKRRRAGAWLSSPEDMVSSCTRVCWEPGRFAVGVGARQSAPFSPMQASGAAFCLPIPLPAVGAAAWEPGDKTAIAAGRVASSSWHSPPFPSTLSPYQLSPCQDPTLRTIEGAAPGPPAGMWNPGKTLEDPRLEALVPHRDTSVGGWAWAPGSCHTWATGLGPWELRALQRLPLSFFPPSAALECGMSPAPTAQTGSSPEAWAFPRMRLY
ncbi:proline-rich protein 19 isoform X1 [Alligator mississippiensis]|uniref:proline-rich protein 19 isoform X1 n=1 Tax=Alligator mississippiensis TaxID=8496 RepID=UPI002877A199|nr:proline-rich protein 19 isoform X1 [Alligator mississippiensis]